MSKPWRERRDQWLKETSLSDELSFWAIDSINKNENQVYEFEKACENGSKEEINETIKSIKQSLKTEISAKEKHIDDLSLNAPNSYKLQVSVPSSLNYLMKAWAAAEGRDLSSIALQCLEIGLRSLKSKGSIPSAAIERYDIACQKRIALAEVSNIWERHETIFYQEN